MTTLIIPSLEWRVLTAVGEEAKVKPFNEWQEQKLQWGLDLLRKIHETIVAGYQELQQALSRGVEARTFARDRGSEVAQVDEALAVISLLVHLLEKARGDRLMKLTAEVRSLRRITQDYHDLLGEALARSSLALPPFDESMLPPAPTGQTAEGYISVREAIDRVRAAKKP